MNESVAFAEKYLSKGALVDANVLLVYLFGQTDPHLLKRSHRTKQYAEGYPVVRRVVETFKVIHTTPNILTEVSNLGKDGGEPFYAGLAKVATLMTEHYCDSRSACAESTFKKLGLTDAGICLLAKSHIVVTFDSTLYEMLRSRGIDAINVNHLIQASWE